MASLKDIADNTGVSVSVVSKVLNNRMGNTRVRPEVAQNIRTKAEELGYRPNSSALALRSGRQNVLGVFIHNVGYTGSGISEDTLEGISLASRETQQRLITTFYHTAEEFDASASLASRNNMDGLLVIGKAHDEMIQRLLTIQKGGLPVITMHHGALHPKLLNVGIDQRRVGYLGTSHLIERGSRSIAHLRNIDDRYHGYTAALADAGLPYRDELVIPQPPGGFGHESGYAAMQALFERGAPFDGVVCQSDAQALGVLNALAERGINVPGQVRVIGVDNSPYCRMLALPLSSICQQYYQRSVLAVQTLLSVIEGAHGKSQVVEPLLQPRRSTD